MAERKEVGKKLVKHTAATLRKAGHEDLAFAVKAVFGQVSKEALIEFAKKHGKPETQRMKRGELWRVPHWKWQTSLEIVKSLRGSVRAKLPVKHFVDKYGDKITPDLCRVGWDNFTWKQEQEKNQVEAKVA